MRVAMALKADYANVTIDGKLNILGVFSEVNPPQLPFVLPMMSIIIFLEADPGDYGVQKTIRLDLQNPNGRNVLPPLDFTVDVPAPASDQRPVSITQVTGLTSLVLQDPGEYRFVVSSQDQQIDSFPMTVNTPKGGET